MSKDTSDFQMPCFCGGQGVLVSAGLGGHVPRTCVLPHSTCLGSKSQCIQRVRTGLSLSTALEVALRGLHCGHEPRFKRGKPRPRVIVGGMSRS